jgi:hypothetical protein
MIFSIREQVRAFILSQPRTARFSWKGKTSWQGKIQMVEIWIETSDLKIKAPRLKNGISTLPFFRRPIDEFLHALDKAYCRSVSKIPRQRLTV